MPTSKKKEKTLRLGPDIIPLKKVKFLYIQWVLDKFKGNKAEAARSLGISVRSMYNYEKED